MFIPGVREDYKKLSQKEVKCFKPKPRPRRADAAVLDSCNS